MNYGNKIFRPKFGDNELPLRSERIFLLPYLVRIELIVLKFPLLKKARMVTYQKCPKMKFLKIILEKKIFEK